MSAAATEPQALTERREHLVDRLRNLDLQIKGKQEARDRAEEKGDDDLAYRLTIELASLLKSSADAVGHISDLERPSTIALYEMQEREKTAAFKPAEGRVADVRDAPPGLESQSLDEIVFVLRTKQKWTWQQIVDWLHAKGVKRPRGGETWHTSAVYAIWKRGFKQSH